MTEKEKDIIEKAMAAPYSGTKKVLIDAGVWDGQPEMKKWFVTVTLEAEVDLVVAGRTKEDVYNFVNDDPGEFIDFYDHEYSVFVKEAPDKAVADCAVEYE